MYDTVYKGASWYHLAKASELHIYGLGGIGSWVNVSMSRSNMLTTLIDGDIYEERNMGGQMTPKSAIGVAKAEYAGGIAGELNPNSSILVKNSYVNPLQIELPSDTYGKKAPLIIVSAVDSMDFRKKLFERIGANLHRYHNVYVVDGRLSAENFQIRTYNNNNTLSMDKYSESLFSDDEIEALPCNFSQTTHIASLIGGAISTVIFGILSNIHENFIEDLDKNGIDINEIIFSQIYSVHEISSEVMISGFSGGNRVPRLWEFEAMPMYNKIIYHD